MQRQLPPPTTIFTCTNCNEDVNEPGDNDVVYMAMPGGGSVPHQPCKRCRVVLEEHNAPYVKMMEEAEARKRAARMAVKAELPNGELVELPVGTVGQISTGTGYIDPPAPPPDPMQAVAQALASLAESQKQILELLSGRTESTSGS